MTSSSAIEYFAAGTAFPGVVFNPTQPGRAPGVLVLHGGAGPGSHEHLRAQRLAELGYVALAPDLFGARFTDRAHGMSVIAGLVAQPDVLRERVGAAWRWLCAQSHVDATRTAAIGCCFGGLAALELARSGAAVAAVVSFHGGLSTAAPAQSGQVTSKILVCTGSADPFITRAQRADFEDEMTQANTDWQMIVHGGALHGFTESTAAPTPRPGCAYQLQADQRSWQAMRDLFEEAFERHCDD